MPLTTYPVTHIKYTSLSVTIPSRQSMISICCSQAKPDYKDLNPDEKKTFSKLVYLLRKRGYRIEEAQDIAYLRILADSIPFS